MIPVFFDTRMTAQAKSFSPSAAKPARVVNHWLRHHPDAIRIEPVTPATEDQLRWAHDIDYIRGVMNCTIPNGFHNTCRSVADSLPWTVGSMVCAARWATDAPGVKRRRSSNVACSPTSGFHHAGWNHAEGFCTFNGLMVAALQMLAEGRAIKVGILDCDFHEGNGTQDILDRMTDAGALLCNDTIVHRSIGSEHLQTARGFRGWLNRALDDMAGCDLVLYQAGADMHKDDPLGGLLDTVGMAERDATVFKHQAQYGYGLVWNLAGGYARDEAGDIGPVLYLHLLTLEACLRVAEVA